MELGGAFKIDHLHPSRPLTDMFHEDSIRLNGLGIRHATADVVIGSRAGIPARRAPQARVKIGISRPLIND
jgi:hypothetical protein